MFDTLSLEVGYKIYNFFRGHFHQIFRHEVYLVTVSKSVMVNTEIKIYVILNVFIINSFQYPRMP